MTTTRDDDGPELPTTQESLDAIDNRLVRMTDFLESMDRSLDDIAKSLRFMCSKWGDK